MKKQIFVLALTMLMVISSNALSEPYRSIGELAAEVSGGWHEDIENCRGETVPVSSEIIVPSVESFPVATCEYAQRSTLLLSDDSVWLDAMDDISGIIILKKETTDGLIYYERRELLFDGQAENNIWSANDAFSFAQDKISTLFPESQFIQAGTLAYGRAYRTRTDLPDNFYNTLNKASDVLDYSTPLDDKGLYQLWLMPTLNGIPLHDTNIPKSYARIQDQENYFICFQPYALVENTLKDIPLCSWSIIQASIKDEIKAGRLRDVYSIRLCYLEMFESKSDYQSWQKQRNHRRIAAPMWIVHGAIFDTAKSELNGEYAAMQEWPDYCMEQRVLQNSSDYLLIHPQTGEVLGSEWNGLDFNYKTVVAPDYISWNEVR